MFRRRQYFLRTVFLTCCFLFSLNVILGRLGGDEVIGDSATFLPTNSNIVSQESVQILDYIASPPHPSFDFTQLFWDKNRNNGPLKLDTILNKVNLWRPTDEFPGNWNNSYDDRILPQLIWAENLEPTQEKVIGLAEGFSYWYFTEDSLNTEIRQQCPNLAKSCKFVDASKSNDHTLDAMITGRNKILPNGVNQRGVFVLESSMHASATIKERDLLISYWRGSDIATPYGKWVYYDSGTKSRSQGRNYAAGKTKMAAIFVSNCAAANNRMGLVKELKNAGIEVDVYGKCGSLKCPKNTAESCFEKLRDYKFYLAFENSNCRDYITEKFFVNALKNDIVPVVMGAHPDDYRNAAPLNSYIHIDDFQNTPAIVAYLNHLNTHDDDYNGFFQWKGTGEFINHKFFCRFCGMLHYGDIVPNRVRNQVVRWGSGKQESELQSLRPCLHKKQFHWTTLPDYGQRN